MTICIITLLWAIAAVETGHDDSAIGQAGERSQYQIMAATWRQHEPTLPHTECRGEAAETVARSHLLWLVSRLGTDPLTLASAWNQGLTGHRRKGPNDYAARVAALYRDKQPTLD